MTVDPLTSIRRTLREHALGVLRALDRNDTAALLRHLKGLSGVLWQPLLDVLGRDVIPRH